MEPAAVDMIQNAPNLLSLDLLHSFCGFLNIREVTIPELHRALTLKLITSKQLCQCYIKRIDLLNPTLNAVLEINPDAISIAEELDNELIKGKVRGILHGIPILIKGNIGTADKMQTCSGSLAFIGIKPKQDSTVVMRLREAGAVILGKANMTELCNFRGSNLPNGWSTIGGMTSNAYVIGATAMGSSSGSAVAVACNLAAAAIGTETDGSIIGPSTLASTVGMKPTVGSVSCEGVIPIAKSQDSIGPITRTVLDNAIIFEVISGTRLGHECFNLNNPSLRDCIESNFRVGVLRKPFFTNVPDGTLSMLEIALESLKACGAVTLVDPVPGTEDILEGISIDGEDVCLYHEFKSGINEYLKNEVTHETESDPIHCLTDLISFYNTKLSSQPYNNVELEKSEATEGIQNENYKITTGKYIQAAKDAIDNCLQKHKLNACVIPAIPFSILTAASGYPIITVPAGIHQASLPVGLAFFGTANSEQVLLQLALLFESVFRGRRTSLYTKQSAMQRWQFAVSELVKRGR